MNCTFSDMDKLLAVLHMADSIVSNVAGGTSKVGSEMVTGSIL